MFTHFRVIRNVFNLMGQPSYTLKICIVIFITTLYTLLKDLLVRTAALHIYIPFKYTLRTQ